MCSWIGFVLGTPTVAVGFGLLGYLSTVLLVSCVSFALIVSSSPRASINKDIAMEACPNACHYGGFMGNRNIRKVAQTNRCGLRVVVS